MDEKKEKEKEPSFADVWAHTASMAKEKVSRHTASSEDHHRIWNMIRQSRKRSKECCKLTFDDAKALTGKAGIALFIFALLIQPSIGPLIGREWSGVELFGLAPDPTVLGTLGVLLAADRVRWELFIIPILWCAITGAILWVMKSPEALLMPLAGLSVLILATYRSLKLRRGLVGI